jgi:hypothetical protein
VINEEGNERMREFNQDFLQTMKEKLDIDIIGAVSIEKSTELKDKAMQFLPTVKSVLVFAKETYKEVVSLVGPSIDSHAGRIDRQGWSAVSV